MHAPLGSSLSIVLLLFDDDADGDTLVKKDQWLQPLILFPSSDESKEKKGKSRSRWQYQCMIRSKRRQDGQDRGWKYVLVSAPISGVRILEKWDEMVETAPISSGLKSLSCTILYCDNQSAIAIHKQRNLKYKKKHIRPRQKLLKILYKKYHSPIVCKAKKEFVWPSY